MLELASAPGWCSTLLSRPQEFSPFQSSTSIQARTTWMKKLESKVKIMDIMNPPAGKYSTKQARSKWYGHSETRSVGFKVILAKEKIDKLFGQRVGVSSLKVRTSGYKVIILNT